MQKKLEAYNIIAIVISTLLLIAIPITFKK